MAAMAARKLCQQCQQVVPVATRKCKCGYYFTPKKGKECDVCGTKVAIARKTCHCGHEFQKTVQPGFHEKPVVLTPDRLRPRRLRVSMSTLLRHGRMYENDMYDKALNDAALKSICDNTFSDEFDLRKVKTEPVDDDVDDTVKNCTTTSNICKDTENALCDIFDNNKGKIDCNRTMENKCRYIKKEIEDAPPPPLFSSIESFNNNTENVPLHFNGSNMSDSVSIKKETPSPPKKKVGRPRKHPIKPKAPVGRPRKSRTKKVKSCSKNDKIGELLLKLEPDDSIPIVSSNDCTNHKLTPAKRGRPKGCKDSKPRKLRHDYIERLEKKGDIKGEEGDTTNVGELVTPLKPSSSKPSPLKPSPLKPSPSKPSPRPRGRPSLMASAKSKVDKRTLLNEEEIEKIEKRLNKTNPFIIPAHKKELYSCILDQINWRIMSQSFQSTLKYSI